MSERNKVMKKLMKSAAVAVCAGAMLCIAGCGGDSPRDIALDKAKKLAEIMEVKNVKFVVKEEKVDESKAKIVIESIVDGKPDNTPFEFEFRKEGGKWKSID